MGFGHFRDAILRYSGSDLVWTLSAKADLGASARDVFELCPND